MITFIQGNLLDAKTEAFVNTVNTVGVMGKGIALMFKERFPDNFKRYSEACKAKEVRVGKMFVTTTQELDGPRWIINFPTKQHWRSPSKMAWITEGLEDLHRVIRENRIKSIAIPPLGSGNGGLEWNLVRNEIIASLSDLNDVEIVVFEPTSKYQNVAKRAGVERLTPARALIADLVRRYSILGMECSLLEIQKLAWFLERAVEKRAPDNPLNLQFKAHKFGPYANRLDHLLNNLDGSYLHCEKRISDAGPLDSIWFDDSRTDYLLTYLKGSEARPYLEALELTAKLIDGFESPFGMELLASVDWLLTKEGSEPSVQSIRSGLAHWPSDKTSGERKLKLFDERVVDAALQRIKSSTWLNPTATAH
jgi:O-acetyl-ADP-ribose deacetylase (regulator of RNase III)